MKTKVTIKKKFKHPKTWGFLCVFPDGEEQWVNAFHNTPADDWSEGQEVVADIQFGEYNGKPSNKFIFPNGHKKAVGENRVAQHNEDLIEIKKKVDAMHGMLVDLVGKHNVSKAEAVFSDNPPPHTDDDCPPDMKEWK